MKKYNFQKSFCFDEYFLVKNIFLSCCLMCQRTFYKFAIFTNNFVYLENFRIKKIDLCRFYSKFKKYLLQTIFVRAWRFFPQINGNTSFAHFIYFFLQNAVRREKYANISEASATPDVVSNLYQKRR